MSEPQSFEQPGIPETREKTEKTGKPEFLSMRRRENG
jgi:hypothetical protein